MDADTEGVFWDIGGVILDHDSVHAAHRAFAASLVDEFALETEPERALETWREAVGEHFERRDGTEFRRAADAYHRGVERVAGDGVAREAWRPLFDEAFAGHIEPEPNALETLEALAGQDVHVGIVSDIDTREAEQILAQFDLAGTVDSVTTSEEVGRTKPDPAMFETALEKASVPPARALMIGDRYRHDIEGAASVGMGTVAYGAEGGPAVDFRVDDLREVLDIVGGDTPA